MGAEVEVEDAESQSALAHKSIAATNHLIEVALQPPINLQCPSLPLFPPVAPNKPPLLPAITWINHN